MKFIIIVIILLGNICYGSGQSEVRHSLKIEFYAPLEFECMLNIEMSENGIYFGKIHCSNLEKIDSCTKSNIIINNELVAGIINFANRNTVKETVFKYEGIDDADFLDIYINNNGKIKIIRIEGFSHSLELKQLYSISPEIESLFKLIIDNVCL